MLFLYACFFFMGVSAKSNTDNCLNAFNNHGGYAAYSQFCLSFLATTYTQRYLDLALSRVLSWPELPRRYLLSYSHSSKTICTTQIALPLLLASHMSVFLFTPHIAEISCSVNCRSSASDTPRFFNSFPKFSLHWIKHAHIWCFNDLHLVQPANQVYSLATVLLESVHRTLNLQRKPLI